MKKIRSLVAIIALMLVLCFSLTSCNLINTLYPWVNYGGDSTEGDTSEDSSDEGSDESSEADLTEKIIRFILGFFDLSEDDEDLAYQIIRSVIGRAEIEANKSNIEGKEFRDDDYVYIGLADGTLGIKEFIGAGDWFSIVETAPEEYQGVAVTRICEGAYSNVGALSTIRIPSSIKVIEVNAFSGCTGLDEVVLYEGLERIESGAFSGCSALNSITIPGSVTYIGYGAFADVSDSMVISCVATSQPESWEDGWNGYRTVKWGSSMP